MKNLVITVLSICLITLMLLDSSFCYDKRAYTERALVNLVNKTYVMVEEKTTSLDSTKYVINCRTNVYIKNKDFLNRISSIKGIIIKTNMIPVYSYQIVK